jgi:iron(III) transport system ATP-binding protein
MYLELEHIKKSFGDKTVVDDLSFSLEQGKLLCILGSSGCGKTTTLNMIGGFLRPDSGRIILDGQDITEMTPEYRPVATVFQSYGLFPHMNVIQNVTYGLKFRHIDRKDAIERGERYLDLVGLHEYSKYRIDELSGGQQQRVALARALAVEPKLCLLDEPFSNLDAALRVKMRVELKNLQEELGITMVFVTHDQEEAIILSDFMTIMDQGRLVQMDTPENIYRNPSNSYVSEFLGLKDIVWGEDGKIMKVIANEKL